jgi:hypothetical protein
VRRVLHRSERARELDARRFARWRGHFGVAFITVLASAARRASKEGGRRKEGADET